MNYIRNRKKILQINIKALKYIKNLDYRFLRNLIILSILKVIKNWYIFIILILIGKSLMTKQRIIILFIVFFLLTSLVNIFTAFRKTDNNFLRNKYNNILSNKIIELSKDLSQNSELMSLSQLLDDYQQYNGGPIIFLHKNLENLFEMIVIFVISILYLCVSLDKGLILIIFIFTLIQFLLKNFLNIKLKKIDEDNLSYQKVMTKGNKLGDFYFSLLSSEFSKMKSVRNNNSDKFIEKKYSEFLRPTIKNLKKYQEKKIKIKFLSYFLVVLNIIMFLAVYISQKNSLNLAVIFMASNLFLSLENLSSIFYELEDNSKRLADFFKFLNIKANKVSHKREWMGDNELIKLNNLSFSYDKKNPILENINFTFSKNKIYSIVGENGEGKSTLVKLILNLINNKNNKMIKVNDNLEDNYISYNLSNDEIFSFSIGENISLNTTYNKNHINKLTDDLRFLDKEKNISDIKLGNDYGNNGRELSGGELKKMIFTRLLYFDRSLVVLDEPISSLDIDSEREIYAALEKLKKGKVLIIISHRLTSCLFSDEVIVLKDKKIYAKGEHKTLYKENLYYKNFFDAARKLTI